MGWTFTDGVRLSICTTNSNANYISLNSDKYFKYKYNFSFVETFCTVILRKITYYQKYLIGMSVAIGSTEAPFTQGASMSCQHLTSTMFVDFADQPP